MRRVTSLQVRIPMLGMAILTASLAIATVVAFQLILLTRHDDVVDALTREQRQVQRSLPQLAEEVGDEGSSSLRSDTLRAAAERYFELNRGVDLYMTIVRVEDAVLTSDDGPDTVQRLEPGEIPQNRHPGLETLDTDFGEILSLQALVPMSDGAPATVQVVAAVEPIRAEAWRALIWLGVASAASLVVGGIVLALMLRRALTPLHALASSMAGAVELEDLGLRVPEPREMNEVGVLTREFNRMLERLEGAAAGQREFMASVSHELRTPVTIARGHIEVLESVGAEKTRDRAETVALVREELIRMQRLVDDLMAVARSRTDEFVVKRPVALPAFFDDLGLRLTGLGTRPVSLGPVPEISIDADGERLAQAVLNLIVNADVHTPQGSRIEVGARDEGEAAAIFVQDRGPGIDPSIRDTMFEPFVKGSAETQPGGVGLAVVAAVVDAHEGKIEVATGPGGTTFTLRIPIGSSHDETSVSGRWLRGRGGTG